MKLGAWDFEPTPEAGRPDRAAALATASGCWSSPVGRCARREGLEVLGLATLEEFPDGLPFNDASPACGGAAP